jgi:hypothetical protein
VAHTIKHEILKSRHDWNKHEPRMWSRAAHLSDHELTHFDLKQDLVLVSSALSTYGTIILGKIRIPAINDDQGEGFIHVRYVLFTRVVRFEKSGTEISPLLILVV